MPDKPMISKSVPRTGEVGADVLHEALAMRQEAERELAEAGDLRSVALAEATQVLDHARAAAATLTEDAESDAHRIVQQAREQALGIVARAREDAEQVLADAHADATEFDAWARQDAQDGIRGEVRAAREALETRRQDVDARLAALRTALDEAVDALEETTRLPSLFLGAEPETTGADHAADDAAPPHPVVRMTLIQGSPSDVGHHDSRLEDDPEDDLEDETQDQDGVVAADDAGDDEHVDADAFEHAVSFRTTPSDRGGLVRADATASSATGDDDAATTVDGFGDGDTLTIDGDAPDDEPEPHDDAVRPLGWLFRSPTV